MKFQRVFSEVSRGFQVRLKGVSSILKEKKFIRCVREVSMVFQYCFQGNSKKVPRSFQEVSRVL